MELRSIEPLTGVRSAGHLAVELRHRRDKAGAKNTKMLEDRRDVAAHERIAPPVALRNADSCGAPEPPSAAAAP